MSRFLSFLLCITLTGNFLSVQTLQAADSEVGTLDISLASSTDTMSFVGIKKSRTTKILDDFKENSKVLLFEKGVFTEQEEEGIFDAGEEVRNLEQMMNRIEESKESLKEQKLEVTSRKFTLQDMLSELESEIVTHTSEIVDAEEHIRIKNKSIADTLRHIVVLQDRIDSNKSAILDYLGYLYGKGNIIMNEGNDIDIVRTLVLTDGNVSDILADYQFQMLIEVTGQNFLEERRSLLRDLYTETQTLKSDKARVIELKQKLEIEKIALQEQQIFKQKLLELTQGQEALFNEYIADRQEKQQKIESRMREVVDRYDTAFGTIAERSGCILEKSGDIRPKVLTNTTACNELAQVYALEKRLRE